MVSSVSLPARGYEAMWGVEPIWIELTLPTPAENLALDEALLLEAEREGGPSWLRLWELTHDTVVLGRSNRVREEVNVAACREHGVPILRRCSGGGAVVLTQGCLNFSLVLPVTNTQGRYSIQTSIAAILRPLAEALAALVPGIEMCGTSDLALNGRKISGNSQRWLRHHVLHQGTLLYQFPRDRTARYLKPPPRQPAYRHNRGHELFLANLPISREQLCKLLSDVCCAVETDYRLPMELVETLTRTKYQTEAWNLQR